MSNTSLLATPPRTTVSREAPNAPSREISSNTTELSSIPMQELPEKVPATPQRTERPLKCPGAPPREFEDRLREFVIFHRLTLDFSNLVTDHIEEYDISTPPKRPNKKQRVSFNIQ